MLISAWYRVGSCGTHAPRVVAFLMTPERVRSIREALNLTQSELACVMGYSKAVRVSELERGARKPSPAAERLLNAYAAGYRPNDWPINRCQNGAS